MKGIKNSINTKIIKIDPNNINWQFLQEAGQAIRDGKLVAFPTETVYGLGADALNREAVLKIFKAKNRPFYDPLIVHVHNSVEIMDFVEDFPDIAKRLGQLFWPGPLTMVLKKSKLISDVITSGLNTVAIRIPNHKVALGLIKEAQRPIAAPSANIFSYTSPTKAQHVISDLEGRVDIILDSGETMIGLESTVLDVTTFPFKILRLGGITFESLKEVVPDIVIANDNMEAKRSPGMLKKHYSPTAKLILVEEENEEMTKKIWELALQYKNYGNKIGIIACKENLEKYPGFIVKNIGESQDLDSCAHNLYAQLRALDEQKCDIIISENLANKGLGRAIMDRLRRAAK
jgi:L-threonylcarbamoyladenylate synthase